MPEVPSWQAPPLPETRVTWASFRPMGEQRLDTGARRRAETQMRLQAAHAMRQRASQAARRSMLTVLGACLGGVLLLRTCTSRPNSFCTTLRGPARAGAAGAAAAGGVRGPSSRGAAAGRRMRTGSCGSGQRSASPPSSARCKQWYRPSITCSGTALLALLVHPPQDIVSMCTTRHSRPIQSRCEARGRLLAAVCQHDL